MSGKKHLVEAYCIEVSKNLGEKAISIDAKLGLLNKDLKVLKFGEHLLMPLKDKLSEEQAAEIFKEVGAFEVIAGSADTETVHKEHGCKYFLDPRKVYFSPRLYYEHYRVASQVVEGETVVDMFAGVDPFSILIAKIREK
ncbi:MAG: hypothetical protein QXT26_07530 [Thermoproteota archaeon]